MKTAITILDTTTLVLLVGSFFVKDNNKAVNMRWGALATFGTARALAFTKLKAKA